MRSFFSNILGTIFTLLCINGQFDDLGQHGTKVVIYNLWLNDNGDLELDFDTDAEVCYLICCSLEFSMFLIHVNVCVKNEAQIN